MLDSTIINIRNRLTPQSSDVKTGGDGICFFACQYGVIQFSKLASGFASCFLPNVCTL